MTKQFSAWGWNGPGWYVWSEYEEGSLWFRSELEADIYIARAEVP